MKTEISILYEEIYKKRIDSTSGNGLLLGKVKDDINDAYAQERISEKHYNLLLERISDSVNKQGSAKKLSSSPASTSAAHRSPIKS